MKKTSGSRSPKFSFFFRSFLTLFDNMTHFHLITLGCQITENTMEKCSLFSFSEEENTHSKSVVKLLR